MSPEHPGSTAEQNIQTVARMRERAARRRNIGQRISDAVARFAARETTVIWHVLWFGGWVLVNSRLLPIRPFDPFPFNVLTTLVSLEAIFLTLFVLESQNRLKQEEERHAQLDLQVNLLAEQEMTLVLRMLQEVCEHLGLQKTVTSATFKELVKSTDVRRLADSVEASIGDVAPERPAEVYRK